MAMVLAPLMAFRPGKQVKQQMAFRDKAIALGMQVKIADMPQTHRAKVRQQRVEQGVLYRLPFRQRQSMSAIQPLWCVNTEQGFEWSSTPDSRIKLLFEQCWPHLPPGSVALELSASGIALYWLEQGGLEQVQYLYEQLDNLRTSIVEYYGVNDANT